MPMLTVVVKDLHSMTTTIHQGYRWHYGKFTDQAGLEEAVYRAMGSTIFDKNMSIHAGT